MTVHLLDGTLEGRLLVVVVVVVPVGPTVGLGTIITISSAIRIAIIVIRGTHFRVLDQTHNETNKQFSDSFVSVLLGLLLPKSGRTVLDVKDCFSCWLGKTDSYTRLNAHTHKRAPIAMAC